MYISDPSKIPVEEHFAIIEQTSVYIPGDERSRTHPGHGYPASTEHYITYRVYMTEEELKKELLFRATAGKPIPRVVYVSPMKPSFSISLDDLK